MCECGCGENMAPVIQFKGPKGLVYALGLDSGCDDCPGPVGVVLYRMPPKALAEDHYIDRDRPLPQVPWVSHEGWSWSECAIPLLGHDELREAISEVLGEERADELDMDGTMDELMRAYHQAAAKTISAFMQRVVAPAARAAREGAE